MPRKGGRIPWRRRSPEWLWVLLLATICQLGEVVGLHLYANAHREVGTWSERGFIETYPGLRIEADSTLPTELYGEDTNIGVICDRYVGWPVAGFKLRMEYAKEAPPPPGYFSIHSIWYGRHRIDWRCHITVLPGIVVMWGKWGYNQKLWMTTGHSGVPSGCV